MKEINLVRVWHKHGSLPPTWVTVFATEDEGAASKMHKMAQEKHTHTCLVRIPVDTDFFNPSLIGIACARDAAGPGEKVSHEEYYYPEELSTNWK